jgi:hypothetical protein
MEQLGTITGLGVFRGFLPGQIDPLLQVVIDVGSAHPALEFGPTVGFEHLVPGVGLPPGVTPEE